MVGDPDISDKNDTFSARLSVALLTHVLRRRKRGMIEVRHLSLPVASNMPRPTSIVIVR